jgi:hypothetical protein
MLWIINSRQGFNIVKIKVKVNFVLMGLLATSLKLTGSGSKHPFLTPALDTDE